MKTKKQPNDKNIEDIKDIKNNEDIKNIESIKNIDDIDNIKNIGICIRYGEIALKGKNQSYFINKLINNIISFLNRKKIKFESIKQLSRRIIIYLDNEHPKKLIDFLKLNKEFEKFKDLKKIFGITSFSPVIITKTNYLNIKDVSFEVFKNNLYFLEEFQKRKKEKQEISFGIDTKRLDKKFKLNSMELNKKVGEDILNEFRDYGNCNIKVNLKNPDIKIGIELMKEKCLIFIKRFNGYGGLPIGTQPRLISLISCGIDSPVASWMMMKRGTPITFLTFYSNKEQLRTVKEVISLLKEYSDGVDLKLIELNHGESLKKYLDCLKKRKLETYTCLFCKKMMLEKAQETAKKENAWGIITGDSLGQVATQTPENLSFIRKEIKLPVFSPVIGMNKEEIIRISKDIGLFELFNKNNKKIGKCPFLPKNPATKVTNQKINKLMNLCEDGE